ncbi:MAG TPA: hypothetical protein VJ895_00225 [Candidatus Nanoarchaeia archaeon]|nr:hypothetical protein [Candidatus Nanoarchaeia archaeon]
MVNKKELSEFISEIELLSIDKIKHHFDFLHREALQNVKKPASPKISVEFVIRGFDKTEKNIEFIVSHHLQAISPDEKKIYFDIIVDYLITFKFLTEYAKNFEYASLEESLKEINGTLRYLTLPYFRKIVQDDTIEAGVPPLVLPLMKVKQSKEKDSLNKK